MSWLSSQKGRLTIGLLVMSSGGLLLAQILPLVSRNDGAQAEKLNLLLIFWVLFCGKMIYQFSLKSSKEDERKNSGDGESKREDSTSYDKSILDQRITKQSTRRKKAARR